MSKTVRVNKPACITPDLPRVALLEASAGTGKTYAITRLVAEWVLEAKLPIERILVVTFTRKAAADMNARIEGALRELLQADTSEAGKGPAWKLDDGARALLATALANFDQAPVSTIHSFCQRVLEEQVILTGVVRDVSPRDVNELFHDAFTSHLRTVPFTGGEAREVLEAWKRLGGKVESLEEVLEVASGEVRDAEQPLARLRPHVDAAVLGPRSKAVRAAFRDAGWPDPDTLLSEGVPEKELSEVLNGLADIRRICVNDHTSQLSARAFQLHFLQPAQRLRETCCFKSPSSLSGQAALLAQHVRALYEPAKTAEGVVLDVFLPDVYRAYDSACRLGGVSSMSRLLLDAREAVQRDTSGALLRRLRERYQGVLVDEFQDTDELQWDILRALFVDGEVATRFVAVGDPKQAIYRFRGGDFETYRAARALIYGMGGGTEEAPPKEMRRLSENRRSTVQMVEAYNRVLLEEVDGEPFFGEPGHGLSYAGDAVVTAAGTVGQLLEVETGEALKPLGLFRLHPIEGQSSQERLRRAVVEEASKLVSGRFTLPGAEEGTRRAVRPADLMVLVASNREAREYVDALNAAGVRAEQYRADGLLQGVEAQDVREVLEALAEPRARASLVKVMRTLFFDVPFEELEQVHTLSPDDPRTKAWRAWVNAAADRDWVGLFGGMRDAVQLRRRAAYSAEGERRLLTVHAVLDRVHQMARERCPDVAVLSRRLAAVQDGDEEVDSLDLDANTYPVSEVEAVRVLTVFKAKGLEAPVVFLALAPRKAFKTRDFHLDVFHGPGEDGKTLRLGWAGELDDRVAGQVALEEDLESRRVQYVALTRAQHRTWLPVVMRDATNEDKGKPGPFVAKPGEVARYEALNTRLFQLVQQTSFAQYVEEREVGPLSASGGAEVLQPDQKPPVVSLNTAEVKQAYLAARGYQKGSFTSLKLDFGTGQKAEKPVAAEVGEDEMPRGADAGTVMHAFLEHAPLQTVKAGQSLVDWMSLREVKDFLAAQPVPRRWTVAQRKDLYALVHAGLHFPVQLDGENRVACLGALGEKLYREVDFHLPWSSSPFLEQVKGRWKVEHGFLTGSIDLVFEHGGRLYFGDWKSNALSDYGPAAVNEVVRTTYEGQVRIYTLALCRVFGLFDEKAYQASFGGAVYLFLRGFKRGEGQGLGFYRPTWAELQDLEAKLHAHAKKEPVAQQVSPEPENVEQVRKVKEDDESMDSAEVPA